MSEREATFADSSWMIWLPLAADDQWSGNARTREGGPGNMSDQATRSTHHDPMREIDLLLLDDILTRSTPRKNRSQGEGASSFRALIHSARTVAEIRRAPVTETLPELPSLSAQTLTTSSRSDHAFWAHLRHPPHLKGEPTMQRRNFDVSPGVRLLQVSVLVAMAAGVAALAAWAPEVATAPATLVVVAAP